MRQFEHTHPTESIRDYSDRRARNLLLKVNVTGAISLLLLFGYLVVSHYQTKLNYLFSSVEDSIAQAIIRGDQNILNNIAQSITKADDIEGVWVTENHGNKVVGFSSHKLDRDFLKLGAKQTSIDGLSVRTILSRSMSTVGYDSIGTLHVAVSIPALKILSLGTLVLGIFLFISLSFLSAFRRLANSLSAPMVGLADVFINRSTV